MPSDEEILQKIIEFADESHDQQIRRYTGDRYIVHPVRVMELCRKYNDNISVLSAAILHDVLEDTPVTRDELELFLLQMLPEDNARFTLELVEQLTDEFVKDKYPKWNRRKRKNKEAERLAAASAEAQTIKYADIIDNAPEITEKDPEFAERFLRECRALVKMMKKGNPLLREKAFDTVNNCLSQLE